MGPPPQPQPAQPQPPAVTLMFHPLVMVQMSGTAHPNLYLLMPPLLSPRRCNPTQNYLCIPSPTQLRPNPALAAGSRLSPALGRRLGLLSCREFRLGLLSCREFREILPLACLMTARKGAVLAATAAETQAEGSRHTARRLDTIADWQNDHAAPKPSSTLFSPLHLSLSLSTSLTLARHGRQHERGQSQQHVDQQNGGGRSQSPTS